MQHRRDVAAFDRSARLRAGAEGHGFAHEEGDLVGDGGGDETTVERTWIEFNECLSRARLVVIGDREVRHTAQHRGQSRIAQAPNDIDGSSHRRSVSRM
ncbi:hypothetical protein D7I43_32400 [Micromonospora globbae]|uniref:Uncharacterized protein n=1 Tax=Micromonospora globbae TaxID=1894969 RepID=A0A420EC35_9ACTN|nr:hypothetical protein D7I43_32400 [Micromonospora globbae]